MSLESEGGRKNLHRKCDGRVGADVSEVKAILQPGDRFLRFLLGKLLLGNLKCLLRVRLHHRFHGKQIVGTFFSLVAARFHRTFRGVFMELTLVVEKR